MYHGQVDIKPKSSNSHDAFWLGMNDLTDGKYRYQSDGIEVVNGMWRSGQPTSKNKHCVGFYLTAFPGQWYDTDCSDLRMSICVSTVEGAKEEETGVLFFIHITLEVFKVLGTFLVLLRVNAITNRFESFVILH